ncbi:hypothetical protein [Haloferax sp. ATB1]|uniref:hypothetical protein n=1 Tax=Haloferax sp. ATB1 TaxID=1508454 RepID=UPI000FE14BA0|nr:hypothetical protein [Haloferax sp. ATB1]
MSDSLRESDDELVPLREEYTNAKERLTRQVSTFRAFAKEGQQMLRITLLFIGVFLTAVSFLGLDVAQQTLGSTSCAVYITPWDDCLSHRLLSIFTGCGLAVSAIGHSMATGNEARAIAYAGTTDDIADVLDRHDEGEYLRERLKSYSDRIDRNNRFLNVVESSLALGKTGLAISIIGTTVLTLTLVLGPSPPWFTLSSVGTLFLILLVAFWATPNEVIREDRLFRDRRSLLSAIVDYFRE